MGGKRHALADFERRGLVIQSQREKRHGAFNASACFAAILPAARAGGRLIWV